MKVNGERRIRNDTLNDNYMHQIDKMRKKRGIVSHLVKAAYQGLKAAIKHVPRTVSPLTKVISMGGNAMPYVDLGITIAQAVSVCPTPSICSLKEDLQHQQEDISLKLEELNGIHSILENLIRRARQIGEKMEEIQTYIRDLDKFSKVVNHVHELDRRNLRCAEQNDIDDCLRGNIAAITFVYQELDSQLRDIQSSDVKQAVIGFVIEQAIKTLLMPLRRESIKMYEFYVSRDGKPKGIFGNLKQIGQSIKSGISGAFRKMFTSAKYAVKYPRQYLNYKLGNIRHKMSSTKRKISTFIKHPKNIYKYVRLNMNANKLSVRSFVNRAGGALTGIMSAISIYFDQKKYSSLEDQFRLAIEEYRNDSKTLIHNIVEANKLQTNYTLVIDTLVNEFKNITEIVAETLGVFDEMLQHAHDIQETNITESEMKISQFRNLTRVILSVTSRDNIHTKQDQLLNIFKNELFNFTEMEHWAHAENKLFEAVQDGTNGNRTVSYMCMNLNFQPLITHRRHQWPIRDVLCNMVFFHRKYIQYDHYDLTEMRDHCNQPAHDFPLNSILLKRKKTMITETVRRSVEQWEIEDPDRISNDAKNSLQQDDYMNTLGEFPDEKEVLCIIAEIFPRKMEYGFYTLSGFRPRSKCGNLTTEIFTHLKREAIEKRNNNKRILIHRSPIIFRNYLRKVVQKEMEQNVPISSVCDFIRKDLHIDDVKREDIWPLKELLCALGIVTPPEMDVYDHYPLNLIRDHCLSGTMETSQLQDVVLKRKESLLEVNIRYHVETETAENLEAMVRDLRYLLMSDSVMASLDAVPNEHELLCIIADIFPDRTEYGMYQLNQFRPIKTCEFITKTEFKIIKEQQERRKIESMFFRYCADSDEPCFPMSRRGPVIQGREAGRPGTEAESSAVQQLPSSASGTSSFCVTRHVVISFALLGLRFMM